ncbi:MAG: DUF4286 family protein [Chitinophagaceae bacterium]|jgi:hypothetical protein|nr:DUF4286 family protein [Chitinophagaceae bacterium]
MIVYNVTSKIDWSIHDAWVKWMKEVHMPEVLATECFQQCQLLRILETDDAEGPTYAAQYITQTKAQQEHYIEIYAAALRQKALEKWGNRMISFRSIMQVVN